MQSKVLLIYTGGTIGMNRNPQTGALEPLDFEHLLLFVPELKQFNMQIDVHQFNRASTVVMHGAYCCKANYYADSRPGWLEGNT